MGGFIFSVWGGGSEGYLSLPGGGRRLLNIFLVILQLSNEHLRNLKYPGGCTPLPDPTPLDSSMLIKQAHVHTVNIDIV